MAQKVLNNKYAGCFEMFLLDYMDYCENFENANSYHNWNDMRIVAYDALFVYCVEHDLENVLEKLQKIKYF